MADLQGRDLARPLNPGDTAEFGTVSKYLGMGKSGFVYLADVLGDLRAVKVYDRWVSEADAAAERLRREATLLESINHPNVCRAFGSGVLTDLRDGSTPLNYLILEYVQGTDLEADVVVNGPYPIAKLIPTAVAILDAMEVLHAKGVVHRDIKPANIMLEATTERVVLMDFGVARDGEDATVTQSGQFLGTKQYGAPEWVWRLPGADVKAAALDVYSLGATLLFLASGKLPFPDITNEAQLLDAVRSQPPTTTYPNIPSWLRALILNMMSKRPESRPNLDEVRAVLVHASGASGRVRPASESVTLDSLRMSMAMRPEMTRAATDMLRAEAIQAAKGQMREAIRVAWSDFVLELSRKEHGHSPPILTASMGSGIEIGRWSNEDAIRAKFRGFDFESADNTVIMLQPRVGVTAVVAYYVAGGPSTLTLVSFVAQSVGNPKGPINLESARIDSGSLEQLSASIQEDVKVDSKVLMAELAKANP